MAGVERFSVSIDRELVRSFDALLKQKRYANRSEAIRDLMRDFIVAQEWAADEEAIGTLTIVYNHHTPSINRTLNALQHTFHRQILSATHVHMDAHNCLEVLILKGSARTITHIADTLRSTRGVKHGKLAMSTTGKKII